MYRSLICSIFLVACSAAPTSAVPATSAKCPPPGSEESLAKMMNGAMSADYQGCHVKTKAFFWSPNTPVAYTTDPSVVVFQITPTTAQGTYYPVKIAKGNSSLIFELKQGDPILLVGGTEKANFTFFVADSIERDPGK